MKAIILARVSTEEQKEAGNSLPAQTTRLENYCVRKGLRVDKTFVFDESAYKDKRDEFDKALAYLKNQKETVVLCFDKVDRLSRNVFDKRIPLLYEMALKGKIEIHFASENLVINKDISAAEKFQFNMSLGLAKYYSDAISDNVKRALEQKLRNGEWLNKAPVGYINIDEDGKKTVVPDPSRRGFIPRIFDLYISGHSMLKIQKMMEKEGFRSRKGNNISKSKINHILKNHFYYGLMVVKGREYPHNYEPLISKYTFDKAQSIAKAKCRNPYKSVAKPFVFKGLITCANCGCRITAERHKKKYSYYSCTNSRGTCKREYVREKTILEPVYEVFRNLQLTDTQLEEIKEGIKESYKSKSKYHKQAIRGLRNEYDALQRRADSMFELLLDKSITKEVYDKKFKETKEKQQDIELQLEDHTKADQDYSLSATQLLSLAQRAAEIFESSETEEKRQLLSFVFQNFQLKEKKLIFELNSPFLAIASYKKRPILLGDRDSNPDWLDQNQQSYH